MIAKFTHVFNDDMTGITFLYFEAGTVQNLSKDADIDFHDEFCVHMSSQDVDKLKSALAKEPNENTVFSPQEMEILKDILHCKGQRSEASSFNYLEARREEVFNGEQTSSMTDREWKEFLAKLS